jgi:glucosamine-6-phosphate deaminase
MDEFYPIDPSQHNSFCNYDRNFYLKNFNISEDRSLLIDTTKIILPDNKSYTEVFPGNIIDLGLRNRAAVNEAEALQKRGIYMVDNWCREYEAMIREMGGIGFFLGGIGPDGHVAFNIRGSDHLSTTRLTATNYETQAAAATDLGGIEISRSRLVITIGLGTITYNPDCTALIFAAGEAKAKMVRDALENTADVLYPGTALQKLKNARFYITRGAAVQLKDSTDQYYKEGEWTAEKTFRAITDFCPQINKYSPKIEHEELLADEYCSLIPGVNLEKVEWVRNETEKRIAVGMQKEENTVYLHTGPHHDDIMLGIFPYVIQQIRQPSNSHHFSILTSGFTSVTNGLILDILKNIITLIEKDEIHMIHYPDFYEIGYKIKFDKDVNHYLNKIAEKDEYGKNRGLTHRMLRNLVEVYKIKSTEELIEKVISLINTISGFYDGEKNPPDIQKLKGMIREYEEELVWAHFGVKAASCRHNRLGFYKGDIFTELPDKERDVEPVYQMIKEIKPDVLSLAFDPEGSGPDTHYKVLQAIAEALRKYSLETDTSHIRILGYRNVWYRFHPSKTNIFIPVSLNTMATLEQSFRNCYVSQVNASFPSPELDGPFSLLTVRNWVDQMKSIQFLLGKDFFYEHPHPKVRATHGFVFLKEMNVEEFLGHARRLEETTEGNITV